MKLDINDYPGGKNGSGVYQWILNHVPKCDEFYDLFAGSGIVGRKLHEATDNTFVCLTEKSDSVRKQLERFGTRYEKHRLLVEGTTGADHDTNVCGVHRLKLLKERDPRYNNDIKKVCVYADPPYLDDVRSSARPYYEYNWSIKEHREFLQLIADCNFYVMISGYEHPLYDEILTGWHKSTFNTVKRSGAPAVEVLWMNYDVSTLELATYDYLGTDFMDRQRIARRKKAYANKFKKMPLHERQAILQQIHSTLSGSGNSRD